MKPRINMITLGVADLEKAVQFYEKGLGLPRMPSWSPPPWWSFSRFGALVVTYGRKLLMRRRD